MNKKVLLVDDNEFLRTILNGALKKLGITDVDLASDGSEAIEKLRKTTYDLVITDYDMPGGPHGLDVVDATQKLHRGIPTIIISGRVSFPENEGDIVILADATLGKPFTIVEFRETVQKLLGL